MKRKQEFLRQNKHNLITLANGLLSGVRHKGTRFDMRVFCDHSHGDSDHCGTAGCAVGYGPFFGIQKHANEDWFNYSHRCFINELRDGSGSDEWDWCFNSYWSRYDNSKRGAAQRIIYMLQYGVPEDWGFDKETINLYKGITGFCPQWLKENGYA